MTATIALMVGISIGCIWMGLCVFGVIWWNSALSNREEAETGTEDTFHRVRAEYDRDCI